MAEEARERVLRDVEALVDEIENLLGNGREAVGEGLRDAGRAALDRLGELRAQLADLEKEVTREVRQGARRTDRYVHDHPWLAVGVAAAAAFALGCAITRRERD